MDFSGRRMHIQSAQTITTVPQISVGSRIKRGQQATLVMTDSPGALTNVDVTERQLPATDSCLIFAVVKNTC